MDQKKVFMVCIILVIVGAINWLIIGLIDFNIFDGLGPFAKIIYIAVGVAAIMIMFNRDTYLPFLGETVMPCTLLQDRVPSGANIDLMIKGPPGKKVIYWAAEPATQHLDKLNTWKEAYGDFMNIGVATIRADGAAILSVRKPQSYTVPWKGPLEAHVHYRICGDNGIMSRVETVPILSKPLEGFSSVKNGAYPRPGLLNQGEGFTNNVMLEKTKTFHPAPEIPSGFVDIGNSGSQGETPSLKPQDKETIKQIQKAAVAQLPMMAESITKLVGQLSKNKPLGI
jgi:uncharacterized membrane protein YuzA (DUF378 family)